MVSRPGLLAIIAPSLLAMISPSRLAMISRPAFAPSLLAMISRPADRDGARLAENVGAGSGDYVIGSDGSMQPRHIALNFISHIEVQSAVVH